MASNFEFRIPSLMEKELQNINDSVKHFKNELFSCGLEYKQTDKVVKLVKDLIADNQTSLLFLLQNTVTNPEKIVGDILGANQKALQAVDSHYKR